MDIEQIFRQAGIAVEASLTADKAALCVIPKRLKPLRSLPLAPLLRSGTNTKQVGTGTS